jgi:hypothetical protein
MIQRYFLEAKADALKCIVLTTFETNKKRRMKGVKLLIHG